MIDTKRLQLALLTVPGVPAIMPSGADGFWGSETDRALAFAIVAAGGVWEALPAPDALPDGYLDLLARIESNNRPYVKATTSSASGLFQFIERTWKGEGGQWGGDPSRAFGGLRPSVEEQRQRATTFTLGNLRALVRAGLPVNKASLYACHFLGAGTAVGLIKSDVKARADVIAGPGPTRANRSILEGKTVADFLVWLHKKTGDWAR